MLRKAWFNDLHLEAGRDDCLIFLPHRLRHRGDVLLVALVVAVLHDAGAARRRHRRHEGSRSSAGEGALEILQVGRQRRMPDIFYRPGAGPSRPGRARMRAAAIEPREGRVLARAPLATRRRHRLDARQPLGGVGLKAHLRLLAVADDVEAELDLLLHDRGHRFGRLARQLGRFIGLAAHARQQQGGKRVRARETAGMGGQNSPLAIVEPGHAQTSLVTRWVFPRFELYRPTIAFEFVAWCGRADSLPLQGGGWRP
jgi:hypothetical protein